MRRIITLIVLTISTLLGFSQTQELDSLSIQLAFETQDSLKVETSLKIIELLYNNKNYDKAVKYIVESEKLSNSLNYTKGIAASTYYKSLIYAQKGDYINAINGYKKSKSIYQDLNDSTGVAKVNNSIGLLEIKRGNYSEGLQYCLAAIKELESLNLKSDLSLAYTNLAEAYYNIGATDYAIKFNLKALDVLEQLNDNEGILKTNLQLAELYSSNKEYRKSIEFYETVLNRTNKNNDSIRGRVYPKLGREYLKFNDYDKASEYLLEGLTLNRNSNDKAGLLLALNGLGDLNLRLNRLNLAEQQLYEAGTIAKSISNNNELLTYYKLMKDLDSTKRRFDRAYIWQREYYDLKQNIEQKGSSEIKTIKASDLEFNPNFDKEISTTTQEPVNNFESQVQETQTGINKFKVVLYGLLAALAIVSTFLILIYVKRNSNIKYTQELEEKNIKIQLQNEAFAEQTQHLENVNNVKDKLFSIISHDLKDSLSSINGFINLMKEGSLTREEFDNLIPELSENANNASLLLFNLLNWSKSQMQSLDPKPSLFDIQEVFEAKVKLIEQRLESKGIELIDHSLRDFAYADRSMIEIVIQNLLANALKFCKKGDTITVNNHISNGSCIISVADTGIGISKENMDKLFKNSSFTTLGTNNEKGTGLGLSICKELVELNNGKIWVESTLNVGTTFYIQLPKSKPIN
ncbi:tetratricopeptide repeat-containing sensor histidine kinase [Aestuariibaculum sp. M13]|uniref:tetratricopeptide repeat-containing sensor histidine kinase n=1 Tax=Aestuariibaculum sp. M13 TaxID=2967132 RepID=UPI002159FD7B|nr:tetratricopeptide repeat-containing sensor histidine kinase [Aestuariibaculum sp. M13]MCR8666585.1 tetratricopeptide repeat-containing sensor histidine kinase [Aestuariibaculum sp. M13]